MKVLIINTVWTGASTGKIAYKFLNELNKKGNEVLLVYGYGSRNYEDRSVICITNPLEIQCNWVMNQLTGYHGNFAPLAMKRLYKIIKKFKPDIIQLYNLHGYYINIYALFKYIKKKKIPAVYSMLDEYPYLGYCCYAFECSQFKTGCKNCDYSRFKKGYLKSMFFNRARQTLLLKEIAYSNNEKLIFAAPQWVVERARESYLLKNKELRIIDEYVNTEDIFYPRETTILKEKLSIPENVIIILNVAPYSDERKGVKYFIELAKKFKKEKYLFINIGYDGELKELPDSFLPIPYVKDQNELATYYSMADLFVCTSFADTMPNVCLDSLACGTPVCGFNITGIPYVAEEPLGIFVDPKDIEALYEIVDGIEKKNNSVINECREYAVKRYSPQKYVEKMLAIYNELVEKE